MKNILFTAKNLIHAKPFLAIGVFSLAAFLLGGVVFNRIGKNGDNNIFKKNTLERQRDSKYKFTSPLLDCNYSGGPFSLKADSMKRKIEEAIDSELENKALEHVSVYFRDLNNGPTMGINEDEKFTPASLLKVPLMIAYLKKAETDPAILKEKITYASPSNGDVEQNYKPSAKLELGEEYEVEELVRRMITFSDNAAAKLLLGSVDAGFLEKVYTDLGIEAPGKKGTENFMTVKDYAAFFRILYNASYLDQEMSEKALGFLSQSEYANGLKAGIPGNVPISHKFGERVFGNLRQLHNCGIVYHSRSPYLLCVMSRGGNFTELEKNLQAISRAVYEEVDRQ